MEKKIPTANQAVAGGGIGGALAIILVFFMPDLIDRELTGKEGALLTGAFGVIFGWLIRFLPQPKTLACMLPFFFLIGCTAEGEYDPERHEQLRKAACFASLIALEEFKAAEDEDGIRRTTFYLENRCPDVYKPEEETE